LRLLPSGGKWCFSKGKAELVLLKWHKYEKHAFQKLFFDGRTQRKQKKLPIK